MPSIISAAAGLMALSGLAVAFPQNGFTNTTSAGNTTSTGPVTATNGTTISNSTASALAESVFCPQLSGSVIVSSTGAEFQLACATNHFGVVLDVEYGNSTIAKRAVVAPTNIQDCIDACGAVTGCVGTAFDDAADTCTLYSELGAAYTADGVDFAVLVSSDAATSASAGQTLTSTLYSTAVQTISSCAPTVTDCPLDSAGAVVTEVVAVTSTDYICPTATVIPASPVACSDCAYTASTVTVYSTTTVSGTVKVAAVSTTVIAVASPTGTSYSTSTVKGSGVAVTTAPVTVAASATATAASATYTGAASNVKAGMGLIAGAGALAAFIL